MIATTRHDLRAAGALASAALFIAALAVTSNAAADARPMVFQSLGLDDGLSQSTVMDVHQDREGFVWIATENGLNRFDGYGVEVFRRERGNPDALAGDYVWAIDEDARGQLWFATDGGGVAVWQPDDERFQNYRHDPAEARSIASDVIRDVLVARSGLVYIATRNNGVDVFDPATGQVIRRLTVDSGTAPLPSNTVYELLQDRDGSIWIGTQQGIAVVADNDADVGGKAAQRNQLAARFGEAEVLSLYEDDSGSVWVGTFRRGLAHIDPLAERIAEFAVTAGETGEAIDVRSILEDRQRRLWVGTSDGLRLFNRADESFTVYRRDPADRYGLSDDLIMSLAEDRQGLIWVGTRAGGVDRWNPDSWLLGHQRPGWLQDAFVTTVANDGADRFWVGALGADLRRYTIATGRWETLTEVYGTPVRLPDPRVMSLAKGPRGRLWVGTMDAGVASINVDGTVEHFTSAAGDDHGLRADGIMALTVDRNERLFVGTFGGGINALDIDSGEWLAVDLASEQGKTLAEARATAISVAADGQIWVATDGHGVFQLDAALTVVDHFVHDPNDATTLGSNRVYSIFASDDGIVWVGTAGTGLERIERVGGTYQVVAANARLPSNVVYGILADERGRLWLSTNHGLGRFNPASGESISFHRANGLQDEEFNFGAYTAVGREHLVFGGAGGLNLFRPDAIDAFAAVAPNVVLTRFDLLNEPASLDVPVSRLGSVALEYSDDIVTFEFSALDYSNPESVRYRYQLLGFDAEPVDAGARRRVTYTNLAAGDYEFRVSAALPNSDWSPSPLVLPISVAPAPWRTPAAYAIYAISILTALGLVLWRQREKLRAEQRYAVRLEQEVQERTDELEQKNVELQAASEAKSNFLARMSHEIRTPMNGVIGMTELLRTSDLNVQQRQLAETVAKSSQSLLAIINDILDISKVEAGRMTLETVSFSLRELFDEVVCLLGANARQRELSLVSVVDADIGDEVRGDPLRLRQVIVNLVGNALKFTPSGQIVLSVRMTDVEHGAAAFLFEVTDTGVGIDGDARERIFSPFAQADESTTRRFGGTGLGLSICRQLVELMDGEIGVDSEPGRGSRFWFTVRLEHPRLSGTAEVEVGGDIVIATRNQALADAALAHLGRDFATVRHIDSFVPAEISADVRALVVDLDTLSDSVAAMADTTRQTGSLLIALTAVTHTSELQPKFDAIVEKPVRWTVLNDVLGSSVVDSTNRHAITRASDDASAVRRSILVVEDNEVNQAVAEGMLARLGCDVQLASNGHEALAALGERSFDLVLMDVQMPGLDGIETTRRLRGGDSFGRDAKIIGVTAQAAADDRHRCIEAGMDDYLAKPFTMRQLTDVCERWLGAMRHVELPIDSPVPQAESPAADGVFAVVDPQAVAQIRALETPERPHVLQRVLEAYLTGSTNAVEHLRARGDDTELPALRMTAHAMKSSSANIGASAYANLWSRLESACDNNDEVLAKALIADILRHHDTVVAALRKTLSAEAA
ncbi:MAG: two-component regulator propeller domain-containing protein [Pseudomonadota bacterium]